MDLVGLEMMRDAFVAPCMGRKRNFGVKLLRDPTLVVGGKVGRPLNILTQISIFWQYWTPKNVKIHPGPFQTKKLTETKKAYLISNGTVPLKHVLAPK